MIINYKYLYLFNKTFLANRWRQKYITFLNVLYKNKRYINYASKYGIW